MALLDTPQLPESLFCTFSWEMNSFHCVLFLLYGCIPSPELGLRSHLQDTESHSLSVFIARKKKKRRKKILVVKFHAPFNSPATIWSLLFLFCGCLSFMRYFPLNFKDMYLHEKNKRRKTTCKLSQEKPLLKTISLLTDGRISWKASTIFTKSNPFSKPKKCYLILSPVSVCVLE